MVDHIIARLKIETPCPRLRLWLGLLGFILFVVIAFASLREREAGPDWGVALERDGDVWRVVWVQPSGMASNVGIVPGDAIIAAEGARIEFGQSGPESITVIRRATGQIVRSQAPPVAAPEVAFTLLTAGAMFFLIGTSVLLWGLQVDQALAFYGLSLTSSAVFLLAVVEPTGQIWAIRLLFIASIFSVSFQPIFFLLFPKNRLRAKRRHALALLLPACLLTTLFALASSGWYQIYVVVRPAAYITYAILSLGAIAAFIWGFIDLWRERTAGQLVVPIAGTAAAIGGTVLTTILPLGIDRQPLVSPQYGALFQVLIPASFAYAILRHRLLGLSGVIRRAMINFFVGVALLAAFAAISFLINRFSLRDDGGLLRLGFEILFVGAAIIVLPTLHNIVRRFIDRAFFRDVYESDKALQEVSRALSSQRSADDVASAVITALVKTLRLTFAAVALRNVGGRPSIIAAAPPLPPEIAAGIETETDALGGVALAGEVVLRKIGGTEVAYVPLISGGDYAGLLCLGPKENGLALSQRDTSLVLNLATQLAMGLDNARLLQTVQRNLAELQASARKLQEGQRMLRELNHRLLMAEEKERRRLAADLHDEPLQRIMMLMRHIDSCPNAHSRRNGICKALASQAADTLRRACTDFHPPLLEDLGLAAALEWLVSSINKGGAVSARIEIDPGFSADELSAEAQIALYRVAQEALNNVLRHAVASYVLVRLSAPDGLVILSVKDDGRGFQMPESLANLSLDGHLGLIGMRERMESVGGELQIFSVPGGGTEVVAALPTETRGKQCEEALPWQEIDR